MGRAPRRAASSRRKWRFPHHWQKWLADSEHRLLLLSAAALGTIWIIATLPLWSLLYEYAQVPLCTDTSLAWFMATLYSPFFIYPTVIGGLSMAALVLPLATAISLTKRGKAIYFFGGFYLLTTMVIAFLEFHSAPPALFEVPADVITQHPAFLAGLRIACGGQKFTGYADQFRAIAASGSSLTGRLYYPGFVAQALMQNALFVVFLVFLYYPKDRITRQAPYLPSAIFFVLGYAIFLGSIWCLFRLAYRNETTNLLGQANPFVGDYAIIVLYAVVLTVFVVYFQFNWEQLAKTIAQIAQFSVFIGGVTLINQEQARFFFGTRATLMNILVLFMLFMFISALTLAFLLRPPSGR